MNLVEKLQIIEEKVENPTAKNITLDIDFVGSEEDAEKVTKMTGIKFSKDSGSMVMSGHVDKLMKFLTSDQKVVNTDDLKKTHPGLFKG